MGFWTEFWKAFFGIKSKLTACPRCGSKDIHGMWGEGSEKYVCHKCENVFRIDGKDEEESTDDNYEYWGLCECNKQ